MNNSLKTLKYISQTYPLLFSEHQGHFDMSFFKTKATQNVFIIGDLVLSPELPNITLYILHASFYKAI